jgi:hypothetical protein
MVETENNRAIKTKTLLINQSGLVFNLLVAEDVSAAIFGWICSLLSFQSNE